MKKIASRVASLEQRVGIVRLSLDTERRNADFERLMSDDEGRAAVVAFSNYMRAHHPDARTNIEALASDPHATRLYKALIAEVERTDTGRWMTRRRANSE